MSCLAQTILLAADNRARATPAAGDKMQHVVANSFEIDIDDTFPRVVNWHEVVTAKPFTQTVTSPEFSICTTESKAKGDAAARLAGEAARLVEGQEIVERRAFDADGLPGIHIALHTYPDGEGGAPWHRHIVILVPPDPSFLYQAEASLGDQEAETTIKAFTAALASFRRRLPERSFAEILTVRESESSRRWKGRQHRGRPRRRRRKRRRLPLCPRSRRTA